jgi:thiosulfate/3-mercaptopyruvate sulfurtransferase
VQLDLSALGSHVAGCDNVLLPPAEFSALMTLLGISTGDAVVAYDDQWGLAAARLLWALHHYGHAAVAVLNGGWDRWRDEGGASVTESERITPGRFVASTNADVHADFGWMTDRVRAADAVLLDTRSPAEFDRGHVPGAISWDWFNAVPGDSSDASRHRDELLAEWGTLGLNPDDDVAVYCRSGMRAAHTYLVLKHAGFARVRLYDGSWQEWAIKMEGGDGH